MSQSGKTWRRLATEMVAIVGSILLAFAIDAWWDDVQLRQDERAALQQLREEFQSNADAIHSARDSRERARGLLDSLIFENAMHGRLVRKGSILQAYSALLATHREALAQIENRLGGS